MKKGPGLLDTGPLVSFLGSGLRHHAWTCEQRELFRPPLLDCDEIAGIAGLTDGVPSGSVCPTLVRKGLRFLWGRRSRLPTDFFTAPAKTGWRPGFPPCPDLTFHPPDP